MNKLFRLALSTITGLTLFGCNASTDSGDQFVKTQLVYTIATDNTGQGVITTFDPITKITVADAYLETNRVNIGANPISINFFNHNGYITLETEKKIDVIDPATTVSKGTIDGLASPAYTVFLALEKAYVTNSKDNHIDIINPNDYSVTGKIELPSNTFAMHPITWNHKVYINCNTDTGAKIIEIDPLEDKVTREVKINANTTSLFIDAYGKLWTMTLGDVKDGGTVKPAIQRIDPNTMKVLGTTELTFEGDNIPMMTMINGATEFYYLNANNIYKATMLNNVTNSEVFIDCKNKTVTALAIDIVNEVLYVGCQSDPNTTEMTKYDRNGKANHTFPAPAVVNNVGFYTVY